jgi:hypothetical protein
MTERERLEQGIAALEAQRGILDDAVIDASISARSAYQTSGSTMYIRKRRRSHGKTLVEAL